MIFKSECFPAIFKSKPNEKSCKKRVAPDLDTTNGIKKPYHKSLCSRKCVNLTQMRSRILLLLEI